MTHTLPNNIWSPDDLRELVTDLKRYAAWLSSYSIKQRVGATAQPAEQPTLSSTALTLLHDLHDRQALSAASVTKLIADLEALQVVAPHITFTLAAPPSNGLKKALVSWCREHISHDSLVSFQFNATILGGMVVRYGSHIYDWSFRRQILSNRGKFPEILRNV